MFNSRLNSRRRPLHLGLDMHRCTEALYPKDELCIPSSRYATACWDNIRHRGLGRLRVAHFSGIMLLEESTARTRISVLRRRSTVGTRMDQNTQHQCLP